jgi:hypothetical protein
MPRTTLPLLEEEHVTLVSSCSKLLQIIPVIFIVRIQVRNEFPLRIAQGRIPCRAWAAVDFNSANTYATVCGCGCLQYLPRIVRRGIIDCQQFPIGKGLGLQRANGSLDRGRGIIDRHYHGDQWCCTAGAHGCGQLGGRDACITIRNPVFSWGLVRPRSTNESGTWKGVAPIPAKAGTTNASVDTVSRDLKKRIAAAIREIGLAAGRRMLLRVDLAGEDPEFTERRRHRRGRAVRQRFRVEAVLRFMDNAGSKSNWNCIQKWHENKQKSFLRYKSAWGNALDLR